MYKVLMETFFRCGDSLTRYMDKKAKSFTTLYLRLQEEICLYLQCIRELAEFLRYTLKI